MSQSMQEKNAIIPRAGRGADAYAPDPAVGPDPGHSAPDPEIGPDPVIPYRERVAQWRALERRVEAAPKDAGLRMDAVLALKNLGDFDEAIVHAKAAIRLRPRDSYLQLLRAELEGGVGNAKEAAAALRKAVRLAPAASVYVQAFDYYLRFHLYKEAAACAAAGAKAHAGDYALATRHAQMLLWYGKAASALKQAERALRLPGADGRAHRQRGAALFLRGKLKEARKAFDAALRADPADLEALSWRADARRRLGDVKGCRADADAAKKLNPRPIGAIFAKALTYLAKGRAVPADEEPIVHTNVPIPLFDLKNKYPGKWKVWIRGIHHMYKLMAGNRSANGTFLVNGKLKRHIHYFPRDPLVDAQSRLRFGDYKRVLAQFARFIKEEPREAYLYSHRGEIRMWAGMYREALGDFAKARGRNKGLLWPRVGRAAVWLFTGKVAEAREEVAFIGRSGGSPSILLPWRVELHRRSKEWDQLLRVVVRDFHEPLPLRPHVWLSKALAHQALGEQAEARRIFEGLARHMPDFIEDACERAGVPFEKKKRSDAEIGKVLEAALNSMRGNRSRWFYTYFTKRGAFRYARIYGLKKSDVPFQLAGQPWLFADG